MALPTSGPLSLFDIQGEFGGSNPIGIDEYYGIAPGVPTEGAISINDFYGTEATEYISATGGTITTTGGKRYHTFTSNGTFNVVESAKGFADDDVEIIVIGGGGSGGQGNRYDMYYVGYYSGPQGYRPRYNRYQHAGGGGGAGGFEADLEPDSANLSNTSVVVGSGGAQGTAGSNGGSSYVSGYDVAGGGGHGASSDTYSAESGQGSGAGRGSGGGGSSYNGVTAVSGASGTYSGGQSSGSSSYAGYFYNYGGNYYIFKYAVNGGGGGGANGNGSTPNGGFGAYNSVLDAVTASGIYGVGGGGGTGLTGSTSTVEGSGGGGGRNYPSVNDTTPDLQAAGSGQDGIVVINYDYV